MTRCVEFEGRLAQIQGRGVGEEEGGWENGGKEGEGGKWS